jgi:hypothetical protein
MAIASHECGALTPMKATPGYQGRMKESQTTARSATGVESCLGFQHSNWCSIDDRIRGRATTNATGSGDMAREVGALARTD